MQNLSNSRPPFSSPRALVIDDDENFRRLLRTVLKRMGYDVLEAPDGAKGCRLVRGLELNLVVTDMIMPEQDGFETILALRRTHPNAKIIVTSGSSNEEKFGLLGVALRLGATVALHKPFTISELRSAIDGIGRTEGISLQSNSQPNSEPSIS